ncbi:hypothetical protein EPIB1_1412 [Tritonibacter mobilis]|nr:hypothetical protein EPIB1_1412 [Tritonibacter mobilis]
MYAVYPRGRPDAIVLRHLTDLTGPQRLVYCPNSASAIASLGKMHRLHQRRVVRPCPQQEFESKICAASPSARSGLCLTPPV